MFLWFISPLWEMSQEGIDIKTIQWSQHWSSRCANSIQTPHLYLAQQCCVEGGLIVLLYPHSYQFLSRYSESFVVSCTSSEDFMEYLLISHFLRTKWFICVKYLFHCTCEKYLMVHLYIFCQLIKIMLSSNKTLLACKCKQLKSVFVYLFKMNWLGHA